MLLSSWMAMVGGEKKGKGRNFGHYQGVETVKNSNKLHKTQYSNYYFICFFIRELRRPKYEINYLFQLIKTYFAKEIKNIVKQGIKINIIEN